MRKPATNAPCPLSGGTSESGVAGGEGTVSVAVANRKRASRWVRGLWMVLGLGACGLGGMGLVVPGMPATVFFILAAYCFSRSSDRLLQWVLGLPKVGPLVRDYREGKGIPRPVKKAALGTMAVVGTVSLVVLPGPWIRVLVLALLLIGASVVWWWVPSAPKGRDDGKSPPARD
ncbi:MAG: YbaN family protein [Verrucomicrobiales bacterium]|nr:YbaN family protein [Verrucomicrobiales bacterium]